MAFPRNVDPNSPASSGSPVLGDDEFRQLKQDLLDLLGLPSATNITGPIVSMGALTDGKLATAPVVKAASPFHRLIGTEASAKDVRIVEDGGAVKIQENTGTEGAPTWTTRLTFTISATGDLVLESGRLAWKSSTAFKGELAHANTANRIYTFPDASRTLDAFDTGTRMVFDQDTAPTGWTRDAAVNDRVINIQGSGARVHGGSWTITGLTADAHTHGISMTTAASGATINVQTDGTAVSAAGHTHTLDGNTGAASATGVTHAPAWRPLHRSMILASKD